MINLLKLRVKDDEIQKILRDLSKRKYATVDNILARKIGHKLKPIRDNVFIAYDRRNRKSVIVVKPKIDIELDKDFFVFKTKI